MGLILRGGVALALGLVIPGQRTWPQEPAIVGQIRLLAASDSTLDRLYQPGGYQALWVTYRGRTTTPADLVLGILARAPDDGLDSAAYGLPALRHRRMNLEPGTASPAELAALDIDLSRALLRFLTHLHQGRIRPRDIGFTFVRPPERHDLPALIRRARDAGTIGALPVEMRPSLPWYDQLRDALHRYRALSPDGPDDLLPVPPTPVRPLDPYPEADRLRHRLVKLGDLRGEAHERGNPVYDSSLAAAVGHFQERHGLMPDQVIGPRTIDALNVPVQRRLDQLMIALERLRWLPDLEARRVVLVNIPAFVLLAWDSVGPATPPALRMRVVVGKAVEAQTPPMAARLEAVEFRPYWNVPLSIAREEVLPAVRSDPEYLDRNQMEVVLGGIDDAAVVPATGEHLAQVATGAMRVRQRPGPANALGLVKFVLPNRADVYLHDTPARELFARSRRDFSHGCIRVERAPELAEWVLHGEGEWDLPRVHAAMEGSKTARVALARPVEVLLVYSTAVIRADGSVGFFPDIYGHDGRLLAALRAQRDGDLPATDPPGIDVNEVGSGVVADPAPLERERRVPQPAERHVGEPDVDRLALHVETLGGDPAAPLTEYGVGPGRPVAGNHLERTAGPGQSGQVVENVQHPGIDDVLVAGPEVTQQVVDRLEGVRQVPSGGEVLHLEGLPGVGVEKGERSRRQRTGLEHPGQGGEPGQGGNGGRYELASIHAISLHIKDLHWNKSTSKQRNLMR